MSHQYYHNYVEAIEQNTIVTKTDINGIITYANEEFCKISGYSQHELIGNNHNIVRHPEVSIRVFEDMWEKIENKQTFRGTIKNLSKEGKTYYLNTTIIPILDEYDNIIEYVAIRYNVTNEVELQIALRMKERELELFNETLEQKVQQKTDELKKLNTNLEDAVKKEIEKNEEKQKVLVWQSRMASIGQMLENIAHQWRQPLTELNLALFNFKRSSLDNNVGKVEEYYNESRTILTTMSRTIDDFSNFFNPKKSTEVFCVEDSVKDSLKILEKVLQKENIRVNLNLKKLKVFGVTNELTQVIINLLQNSKEAFNSNSVNHRVINIKLEKLYKDRTSYASLRIKDNAKGIPDEIFEKIFEPYFTTKHESQGTGLGLFMSKMIIEQSLNGSIEARNVRNGVSFTINIPLEK